MIGEATKIARELVTVLRELVHELRRLNDAQEER